MNGIKFDTGKLPWHLLPIKPVNEVLRVLAFGAEKYDDDNWKKVENKRERYYAACMRHVTAWFDGETTDPESGLHHLAHATCCLLFLMWGDIDGSE